MKKSSNVAAWLLIVLSALMLAGCGKKPPECADGAAKDSLRNFMNSAIVEALPAKGVKVAEDTGGLIQRYLATWAFDLSNVTSSGYDEKSKTRSCAGKVSISIPDTQQKGHVDVQYDMQVLEDSKSGDFQLRATKNFQIWSYGAMEAVANHYKIHSISGSWSGVSQCGPTEVKKNQFAELPPSESQQGFTVLTTEGTWQPDDVAKQNAVTVSIKDGAVSIQIALGDGKSVQRKGNLAPDGSFKAAAEDDLKTAVLAEARVSQYGIREVMPNHLSARARVKSNATGNELDALLTRRCSLDLKKN